MDKLKQYQDIIKEVLTEYAAIPYAKFDLKSELIINENANRYLIITMGWEGDVRVHGCVIHLDIIDDKIWIQRDGTEDGIANDLVAAGIPKTDIRPLAKVVLTPPNPPW